MQNTTQNKPFVMQGAQFDRLIEPHPYRRNEFRTCFIWTAPIDAVVYLGDWEAEVPWDVPVEIMPMAEPDYYRAYTHEVRRTDVAFYAFQRDMRAFWAPIGRVAEKHSCRLWAAICLATTGRLDML